MRQSLEIRKTHKYVGSCKDLDEHEHIGEFEIEASHTAINELPEPDPCEPQTTVHFVRVYCDKGVRLNQKVQALKDYFTSVGCSHEYDCCGCRSYWCNDVEVLRNDCFRLVVTSSRNF